MMRKISSALISTSTRKLYRPMITLCSRSSQVETTIIKPASRTPIKLERYNLSSRDINTPHVYMPLVFFYRGPTSTSDESLISNRLKQSLSQILTQYYPFAGRLLKSESMYVDCHDQGVEFIESRVDCSLNDILCLKKQAAAEDDSLGHLFPPDLVWAEVNHSSNNSTNCSSIPIMVIQLNRFNCGGVALAVSLSHKITDGRGFSSFLVHWSAVSRQSGGNEFPPAHFVSWPSRHNESVPSIQNFIYFPKKNWITKYFTFPNFNLAKLMTSVTNHGVTNPTRVEILAALLYKSSIGTTSFSPSVLLLPADMRGTIFMQPKTAVGNYYCLCSAEVKEVCDVTLHELTDRIKKGKMQLKDMEGKDMEAAKVPWLTMLEYAKHKYGIYVCSSLCNSELYDVDFGWGKPIKVRFGDGLGRNFFGLMDTAGGDGIEAMVCLGEEEMLRFQRDEHILAATADYLH